MTTTNEIPGVEWQVEHLTGGLVRLRAVGLDGPQESLLDRYGIVNRLAPEPAGATTVALGPGSGFTLTRGGKSLAHLLPSSCVATAPTMFRNRGYRLDFALEPGEKLLGFGDHQRAQLLLNGLRDELFIRYPAKHVPVPFFMSSRGYGVFFNTTRRLRFDAGATDPARASFAVEKEFPDLYLFAADSFDEMIERYTFLTGRPGLPPMKSFGLWLLFHTRVTGHEVMLMADRLREKRIPLDNLGLEPNWMQDYYDASTKKEWNAERFRGCEHGTSYRAGPAEMIRLLNRRGFDLGLWLCSRWDFTWEEERRYKAAQPAAEAEAAKNNPLDLAGLEISHHDENVGHADIRMDTNTVRDEAWFEHLKKFVKDGVRFFKLDPAWLINEFPDRLYGNGRTDEEMHNLAFLLASKQMTLDYEAFTGRRYYGISVAGWAGQQRYPGTWAGDTGGGLQPMTGILQDSLVGHPYATCDMNAETAQGIHMGCLLPWALVNSWGYFRYPGFQDDGLNDTFRHYLDLRMRLIPYYYSLAWRSTRTGRGIARPLCLEYPERDWCYHERKLFLIGDALLADVYGNEEVRLPAGDDWIDLWTGTRYRGDDSVQCIPLPANRGGHLFLRAGYPVPTQAPGRLFVDPSAINEITWWYAKSERPGAFTLYLDDGDTLAYREGRYGAATLRIADGEVTWGAMEGNAPEFMGRLTHKVAGPDDGELAEGVFRTGTAAKLKKK